MKVCRKLRWKGYSEEALEPAMMAFTFARNQVPYTCLTTCQPWGEDDQLAAPETCGPDRKCHEKSALVTIRVR